MVKYHDQKQFKEQLVHFGLWFQRTTVHTGREGTTAGAEIKPITFGHTGSREYQLEEVEQGYRLSKPQWYGSFSKALGPNGSITSLKQCHQLGTKWSNTQSLWRILLIQITALGIRTFPREAKQPCNGLQLLLPSGCLSNFLFEFPNVPIAPSFWPSYNRGHPSSKGPRGQILHVAGIFGRLEIPIAVVMARRWMY